MNKFPLRAEAIPDSRNISTRLLLLVVFCVSLKDTLKGQSSTKSVNTDTAWVQARPQGELNTFFEFIADNFKYPTRCQSEGINGSVLLEFIVETDGSLSNFTVKEDTKACPEFTKEAFRVMQIAPKWIPASKNGLPVKSYRLMPIRLQVAAH